MVETKKPNKKSHYVTLFAVAAAVVALVLLRNTNISHNLSIVGKMVVVLLGFGLEGGALGFGSFLPELSRSSQ